MYTMYYVCHGFEKAYPPAACCKVRLKGQSKKQNLASDQLLSSCGLDLWLTNHLHVHHMPAASSQ